MRLTHVPESQRHRDAPDLIPVPSLDLDTSIARLRGLLDDVLDTIERIPPHLSFKMRMGRKLVSKGLEK